MIKAVLGPLKAFSSGSSVELWKPKLSLLAAKLTLERLGEPGRKGNPRRVASS